VAKFTKLKYLDLLLGLGAFQHKDYEKALKQSFHKIDELLEDPQFDGLLRELRAIPNPSDIASKCAVLFSFVCLTAPHCASRCSQEFSEDTN
jgi:hypothetical protein